MTEMSVESFTLKQARKSTLVVAGVLALIAAYQMYRGRTTAVTVLGTLIVVLLGCAAIPAAAKFFHKWWMTLALALGYVNSRILLFLLFYGVVTPIGFMARSSGHDPLECRKPAGASHWRQRATTRQSREGFERAY